MSLKSTFQKWPILWLAICLLGTSGCGSWKMFPTIETTALSGQAAPQRAYDTDGNGRDDYFQQLNQDGRIVRLGFDLNKDGSIDQQVDLDELDLAQCRELYILLDGVPYQMLADMYAQGHFRLFHRPSRLISCFPTMTDIAFAEIFGLSPVLAYQAGYYDQSKAKLHDGNMVYLSGENEPWNERLDYRGPLWIDAVSYVWPQWWLDHELQSILSKFRKSKKRRISGYSVSSTSLGTNKGGDGYRKVLLQVEQLCEAAMLFSKGKLKITVFADHGHNLTAAKPLPLTDLLKQAGFRVVNKVKRPHDVVVPEFGLITYAAINTLNPQQVAAAAVKFEGINLAIYKNDRGQVVVLDRSGKAVISKLDNRYRYQAIDGDPLQLEAVVAELTRDELLDEQGYAADADWFERTARHQYPDALARIWRAFHGLVKNTPTLLVTTHDGWYCGKGKFEFFVNVASTHGSLNYINSVTFAMTTAGELPSDLRLTDLLQALKDLGLGPP